MLNYVMGLTLSFTDNASAGLQRAVGNLNSFINSAENASNSLNSMASLYALSSVADNLGSSFLKAGTKIYQGFSGVVGKVQDVGTQFQSLRIILTALDKDEKKAEESLNKLVDFAATTPFELEDLTGLFTTIKANGIDAFEVLTGATSGIQENIMSAIGDLMMFRSDVPAQQWALAIRNAFSGQKKSLQTALDINVEDMLGRKWGDTPEQIAQDFIDLADAIGVAGMMGGSFENNMKTQLANISDLFTKTWLKISDAGVFNDLLFAVQNLTRNLTEAFSDERLVNFAQSVQKALHPILKVVGDIVTKFSAFIPKLVDFLGQHPMILRMLLVSTALNGVLLTLAGIGLKLISSFSDTALIFKLMKTEFSGVLATMGKGLNQLRGWIFPIITLFALLALAWKTDFAGIQTRTKEFVGNVTNAFNRAREGISGDVENLKSVMGTLDRSDFFDGLTLGIMRVQTLFGALREGWNNYTLSEDTFKKAKELGILPLIEALFDLKYRWDNFKEGFKEGWKEIGDSLKGIIDNMKVTLKGTIFEDLLDKITQFTDKLGDNDAESWNEVGKIFGGISAVILACVTGFKLLTTVLSPVFKIVGKIGKAIGNVFKLLANNPTVMIITGIITAVSSFISMLKDGFSWVKEIIMIIGIALTVVGAIIAGVEAAPAIIVGAIVALVATIVVLVKQHWNEIVAWFESAGENIRGFFTKLGEDIRTLWTNFVSSLGDKINTLKTNFKEGFNKIKENVTTVFTNIKNGVVNKINEIKSGVKSGLDRVKTTFTNILGAVKNAVSTKFNEIKTTISNIIDGAKTTVQKGLNAIKGFFNKLKVKLPDIKLPHFKIDGKLSINPPSVPKLSIDWYEKGGVFKKPNVIGVGENGTEAVMPLQKNTEWIGILAGKLLAGMNRAELVPTNKSYQGSSKQSQSGTGYMKAGDKNTSYHSTSDSHNVTFNQGAITIVAQNSSAEEAQRLAKQIMQIIKRQNQIDAMANYKS